MEVSCNVFFFELFQLTSCCSGSSETQASAQRRLFAAPYTSVTCQGVHCVSDICSLSNAFPIIDLVRPFVTVLNHVGFICPNALADSLLPIMNEHGRLITLW